MRRGGTGSSGRRRLIWSVCGKNRWLGLRPKSNKVRGPFSNSKKFLTSKFLPTVASGSGSGGASAPVGGWSPMNPCYNCRKKGLDCQPQGG